MVKSIHIGRAVRSPAEFDELVRLLQSLGLQTEETAANDRQNATFVAPLARLNIARKAGGDLRMRAEGTDLLLEVSDPDSVYSLLEQREIKIISDHQDGALR